MRTEEEKTLHKLRWKKDQVITNHFNEKVYLTDCFNDKGEKIGITECCDFSEPCEHHKKVRGI